MTKKRIAAFLLAILLVLGLCGGCDLLQFPSALRDVFPALLSPTPALSAQPEEERVFVPFSEMRYVKQDANAIAARLEELTAQIAGCRDIDALEKLADEGDALLYTYQTMYALAMINASKDMGDSYWVGEKKRLAEEYTAVQRAGSDLWRSLYSSPFKEQIEREWDEEYFLYIEDTDFVNDDTQPLYDRVATLTNEYTELLNMAKIDYKGKSYTIYQLYGMSNYADWVEASRQWYEEYQPQLGGMYVELVQLRQKIAKLNGFKNYTEMAFYSSHTDYTPEMAKAFLDDIVREMVPMYDLLSGVGRYYPNVDVDYDEFMAFLQEVFKDLSPDLRATLDAMMEYGLYDLAPAENKESGAYTIFLADYDVPFIMGSFEGDLDSLSMVVHELGHFYSYFLMMKESSDHTDLSEVHSQALELLASNYFHEYFGETTGYEMQYDLLYSTASTIVEQPYYTALEFRIYELDEDEITLEMINEIALEEAIRFSQHWGYEGHTEWSWVLMSHIVERPFSTLPYATSVCVALELFMLEKEDGAAAIEAYEKLVRLEGGDNFIENVEYAGLENPFAPGRMKELAAFYHSYLYLEEGDLAA